MERFHHVAYVVRDQAATRAFYEDVVGLPLVATWAEVGPTSLFPDRPVAYCHTFFGLPDGSTLAFFAFADDDVYEAARIADRNGYTHSAITVGADDQARIRARLQAADYAPFEIDHGYCRSLYVNDPDGMILEFTCDPDDVDRLVEYQRTTARETLDRWLAGDHTPNNDRRSWERA